MNTTKETFHGNKVTVADYEYGMCVSFGALFMFIIVTYALWKCIALHSRAAHRNSIEAAVSSSTTTTIVTEGLDEATLITIPKLLYSENKPNKGDTIASAGCSICLADYKDNHMLRQFPCGHLFHMECIDPWLRLHATCPICRDSPICSGIHR